MWKIINSDSNLNWLILCISVISFNYSYRNITAWARRVLCPTRHSTGILELSRSRQSTALLPTTRNKRWKSKKDDGRLQTDVKSLSLSLIKSAWQQHDEAWKHPINSKPGSHKVQHEHGNVTHISHGFSWELTLSQWPWQPPAILRHDQHTNHRSKPEYKLGTHTQYYGSLTTMLPTSVLCCDMY